MKERTTQRLKAVATLCLGWLVILFAVELFYFAVVHPTGISRLAKVYMNIFLLYTGNYLYYRYAKDTRWWRAITGKDETHI